MKKLSVLLSITFAFLLLNCSSGGPSQRGGTGQDDSGSSSGSSSSESESSLTGIFADVVPAGSYSGQNLKISYQKGLWLDIGQGHLVTLNETTQELKGAGGMAGQSASVYLLLEDLGSNTIRITLKITGAANYDWDKIEAPYIKSPGLLTVNDTEAVVTQKRYEKECNFMGCKGPGIEVLINEKKSGQHRLRFDLGKG